MKLQHIQEASHIGGKSTTVCVMNGPDGNVVVGPFSDPEEANKFIAEYTKQSPQAAEHWITDSSIMVPPTEWLKSEAEFERTIGT